MSNVYLGGIWLGLGLLVGLLGLAARLKPVSWGKAGPIWLLALGVGAALLGGLLGTWLLGRLFASPLALWVAVLAVCAPWLYGTVRLRFARPEQG
jgi:hypothetical protein